MPSLIPTTQRTRMVPAEVRYRSKCQHSKRVASKILESLWKERPDVYGEQVLKLGSSHEPNVEPHKLSQPDQQIILAYALGFYLGNGASTPAPATPNIQIELPQTSNGGLELNGMPFVQGSDSNSQGSQTFPGIQPFQPHVHSPQSPTGNSNDNPFAQALHFRVNTGGSQMFPDSYSQARDHNEIAFAQGPDFNNQGRQTFPAIGSPQPHDLNMLSAQGPYSNDGFFMQGSSQASTQPSYPASLMSSPAVDPSAGPTATSLSFEEYSMSPYTGPGVFRPNSAEPNPNYRDQFFGPQQPH